MNPLGMNMRPKGRRNQINSRNRSLTPKNSPPPPPLAFASYNPQHGFLSAPQRHQRNTEFAEARNLATVKKKLSPLVVQPDQPEMQSLTVKMMNNWTSNRMNLMMPHPHQRRGRRCVPRLLVPHMATSARWLTLNWMINPTRTYSSEHIVANVKSVATLLRIYS